jgi:hypothetical protein
MHHVHIPFMLTIVWVHTKTFLPKVHPLLIKVNAYDRLNGWLDMKLKSRKLLLLYTVIALATLGTFVPPIINWALTLCGKNPPPFEILGSTEWVSMISLVVSTYFGSNVWEKHVAISNGIAPSQLDNTCMIIKGSPGAIAFARNEKEQLKEEAKHGD